MHAATSTCMLPLLLARCIISDVCVWQFVLGVDQSVWNTFGPKHLKDLLSQVGKLTVKLQRGKSGSRKSAKGIGAAAACKFLSAAGMVAVLVPLLVIPQMDILIKTGDALCGAYKLHCCLCTCGRVMPPF